jgi:hypothetical protein
MRNPVFLELCTAASSPPKQWPGTGSEAHGQESDGRPEEDLEEVESPLSADQPDFADDSLYIDVRPSKPAVPDTITEKTLVENEFLRSLLEAKGYICTTSPQTPSYRLEVVYKLKKYGKALMDQHELPHVKIAIQAGFIPPNTKVPVWKQEAAGDSADISFNFPLGASREQHEKLLVEAAMAVAFTKLHLERIPLAPKLED